jgi:hypothetical protein
MIFRNQATAIATLFGSGFFLLMLGWALVTPLNATDEAAQVVKAAATVRLQNLGTVEHVPGTALGVPATSNIVVGDVSAYRLPASFAQRLVPCYAASQETVACAKPMSDSATPATAYSYVGNYNPTYYLLVGWPTLFLLGAKAVYAMRVVTALLNAILLGFAARCALEARRPRRALLCLVASATPITMFFGGIVNPNGTEICAAILVWSALLHLATARRPPIETLRRIAPCLGLGLFLLLNVRMLGPLWVALAAAAACWVAEPAARRTLLRNRPFCYGLAATTLVALGSLAWTASTPLELLSLDAIHPHFLRAAHLTLNNTPAYLREMLFAYDWAEAPIPTLAEVLLTTALAVLLVPLLAVRRYAALLLSMAAAVVAIPVVLQGYEMQSLGMIWQGRYLLPFAVGLVLVAGYAPLESAESAEALREFGNRTVERWMMAFLTAGGLTCLWWAVRRNANKTGLRGSLLPMRAYWIPPVTWPGALVPYLLGALLLAVALWQLGEESPAWGLRLHPGVPEPSAEGVESLALGR